MTRNLALQPATLPFQPTPKQPEDVVISSITHRPVAVQPMEVRQSLSILIWGCGSLGVFLIVLWGVL